MKYNLAKRLKDAEFPQWGIRGNGRYDLRKFSDDPDNFWHPGYMQSYSEDQLVPYTAVIPTLSELIEACGEGFETLSRDTSTEKVSWIANNYHDADAPEEQVFGWYEGATPEEAVANLWLALNGKK